MRTTQDRFTDAAERIAADAGLDFVNDRAWANTGTFRFVPAGTFTPKLEVSYQFNDNYATFGGGVVGHYTTAEKLDGILAQIREKVSA